VIATPTLLPIVPEIASTIGRIALGALFIVHGWPKIKDPKSTIGFVKGTGFPGGAAFAVLFTLLEFFGGVALILGFLTQIVAPLIALEMVATTVFAKTKLGKKLVLGYELDIAYLVLALMLTFLGAGPWSVDRFLGIA